MTLNNNMYPLHGAVGIAPGSIVCLYESSFLKDSSYSIPAE